MIWKKRPTETDIAALSSKLKVEYHDGIYSGDGIDVGKSNDITLSGLSHAGYKIMSISNLTTDSGTFIAIPLSNTDTSITFRLVNVGDSLIAPGTIYFDALYIMA